MKEVALLSTRTIFYLCHSAVKLSIVSGQLLTLKVKVNEERTFRIFSSNNFEFRFTRDLL